MLRKYVPFRILSFLWKLILFIGLNSNRVYAIEKIAEEVNLQIEPWWQILPGYQIFLAIFGCLYFIFVIQVLSHFIEEQKHSIKSDVTSDQKS
jgi:quinol-cytochrome oxidoreductase complex cytochrome b subunit